MRTARASVVLFLILAISAFACTSSVSGGSGGGGGHGGAAGGTTTTTSTSSSTTSASTTSTGSTSTSSSSGGTGGGGDVACGGGAASKFPTFDKACSTTADCVVELHQVNCCGTHVAIGMRKSEAAAFAAAEATCEAMYPGCGCAQQGTQAEDGKTALDEKTISVACTKSACRSFVP